MKGQMRIYYDEEADYLTIFVAESGPNHGEDISSGVTLFRSNETNEVVGIGILNFKEKSSKLNEIEIFLPFKINFELK